MSTVQTRPDTEAGNARRAAVVVFLRRFIKDHGYSPSLREIGSGVGLASTQSVHKILHRLRDDGRVTFLDGHDRTLRPVARRQVGR